MESRTEPGNAPGPGTTRDAGNVGAVSADDDLCDVHTVHEESVRAARSEQSAEAELTHLAETFQVLANPTRLRIVEALSRRELCVCDLAAVVGSSQSSVSHHLRQLRQMQVVRYRKEGRMAFYRLDDEHIAEIFGTGLEHVRE